MRSLTQASSDTRINPTSGAGYGCSSTGFGGAGNPFLAMLGAVQLFRRRRRRSV